MALVPAVGWLRYDAKSYPLSAVGTNNNGASGDGDKPISHINQSPFVYQNTGELKFWTPSGVSVGKCGSGPSSGQEDPRWDSASIAVGSTRTSSAIEFCITGPSLTMAEQRIRVDSVDSCGVQRFRFTTLQSHGNLPHHFE